MPDTRVVPSTYGATGQDHKGMQRLSPSRPSMFWQLEFAVMIERQTWPLACRARGIRQASSAYGVTLSGCCRAPCSAAVAVRGRVPGAGAVCQPPELIIAIGPKLVRLDRAAIFLQYTQQAVEDRILEEFASEFWGKSNQLQQTCSTTARSLSVSVKSRLIGLARGFEPVSKARDANDVARELAVHVIPSLSRMSRAS